MNKRDRDQKIDPDNKMPEHIKQDPERDLSDVPGSYNPGNQAGKGGDVEQEKIDSMTVTPKPERRPKEGNR